MFQYDPFQLKAIQAIDEEKSVLVSAPTGAGKTAIAEYAIDKALSRNERILYTAPIKALSNQKYRDFSLKYGPDTVGILTGDVSLNPDASLVIMTTEIYRNQLFEDPARLKNTAWVIFDEVHYLDDVERGTVWEEAIMFSPEHVRFLALSATAPNIEELAQWIRNILKHEIEVIVETHRPVPLVHIFQCNGRILTNPQALKKEGYLDHDHWPSGHEFSRRPGRRERFRPHQLHKILRAHPNRMEDLVRQLLDQKQLPCLYFSFGRKRTEELAWEQQRYDFLTPEEKATITNLYQKLCEKFDLLSEPSAVEMKRIVLRGVAFHHAGMLPTLKEVVEQLFTSKLIKLIFTTETFALGINMPAKTVVFDELRKFYGTHFGDLRTRDFFQMAGRAGRRGMDKEGFVYTRINPHQTSYTTVMRILYGKPEPIESQFNSCYATLLNLYSQFGSKLIDIYPRSFHFFQSNKKGRRRAEEAMGRKLELLSDLGYIASEKMTQKGEFASWMYGYELILSEMLEEGYLNTLNETQLAALLCSLVFEPRKNQLCPRIPAQIQSVEKRSMQFLKKIHAKEAMHRVWPYTKVPYFHLAPAVEAWVGGCRFVELGRHSDADDGELIRHFRMAVQLLRQIKHAPQVSPGLRKTADSAFHKINRDLVDAEKQLRNM